MEIAMKRLCLLGVITLLAMSCGQREEKEKETSYESNNRLCVCMEGHCHKCPDGLPQKVVVGSEDYRDNSPSQNQPIIVVDRDDDSRSQAPRVINMDGRNYTCYPRPATCTVPYGRPCPFIGRLRFGDRFREIPDGNNGMLQCVYRY